MSFPFLFNTQQKKGITQGLQIVTTRNMAPNNTYQPSASSRTDTRNDNRSRMYSGSSSVSKLKVAYRGVIRTAGGNEANLGNDYGIEFAVENSAQNAYVQATFGGSLVGTVTNGGLLVSDEIPGFTLAADSLLYGRSSLTIAANTLKLPRANQSWTAGSGDFTAVSAAANGQVAATGAMTTPTGGDITKLGLRPFMLLGMAATPMVSVAIFGDSIADGVGENGSASSKGSWGYVARGLDSVNGHTIPYVNLAVASNRLQYDTSVTGAANRAVLPYVTHVINELGTNDISGGASLATVQNYILALAAEVKAITGPYGKKLKFYQCKITPRTTSTDSWATIANQTQSANFTTGGVRDQLNTWLDTQVGVTIDGVIDPNQYIEDDGSLAGGTGQHGKWIVNGTANYATNDGIHPRTATHILAAQAVTTVAATFAP